MLKSNWKTTLLGIIGGVAMMFGSMANARANGGPPITAGNVIPGLAIAALGAAAKDHNVTGGTSQQ